MPRIATLLLAVWLFLTGVELASLRNVIVPQHLVALGLLLAEVAALRWDAVRWVSFVLGAWLTIAPLALHYSSSLAALNSFAVGLLVLILASRATRTASYGEPPAMQQELFRGAGEGRAIR